MSNAKDPEGSRFALVSVISSEDALICIQNLDGFELHGRIIHVDKVLIQFLLLHNLQFIHFRKVSLILFPFKHPVWVH